MASSSRMSPARVVLIVLGVISATAGLLVPLAPVRQDVATYSWPVNNSTAPVEILLYPYQPELLKATFSCGTVAALARRTPDGTVFATTPTESPDGHRDGLVAEVVGGELRVTSRGRALLAEPAASPAGCTWRVESDGDRTAVSRDGVMVAGVDEDIRPQVRGVFSDLDADGDSIADLLVQIRSDTRFQTSPTRLKQGLAALAVVALAGA
ncbi:MAG: arabinosyltransferase, partial [Actinomycetota bacterium]|nr:arabinosyltransferase [Actinomycetota bacterium]